MLKTVLLVIDLINGICGPGTPYADYLSEHPELIQNENKLISYAEQNNIPVVFVRLAFDSSYKELKNIHSPMAQYIIQNKAFLLDTPQTQFINGLQYSAQDIVLNKKYIDPFYGSGLQNFLKQYGAQQVIFTGVATDLAINYGTNTAMTSGDGYTVTVVSDATGATDDDTQQKTLQNMMGRTVTNIMTTDQLLQEFSSSS